jgi:hypothetical protein
MKIHNTTNNIAIIPLIIEENRALREPNPVRDIGPSIAVVIPPPIKIKIHIQKIKK